MERDHPPIPGPQVGELPEFLRPEATGSLHRMVTRNQRARAARFDHERERDVIEYVLSQSPTGETVVHVEQVATHRVRGATYEVWDVHTKRSGRWWVISPPMNLYTQRDFPSMDKAFSFHLGLMLRVMAKNEPEASEEEQDRLATPWRRWKDAADALDEADETEEFQAVGVRLREALLAFVKAVAAPEMVPAGEDAPKMADFIHWAERIADAIAHGPSSARVRGHLKATAKSTWELVSWLTHESGATRMDGALAVSAVAHALSSFGMALVRHERGEPDRCPTCGSYRLTSYEDPERAGPVYVTVCEACGWEDLSKDVGEPIDVPATHNEFAQDRIEPT